MECDTEDLYGDHIELDHSNNEAPVLNVAHLYTILTEIWLG